MKLTQQNFVFLACKFFKWTLIILLLINKAAIYKGKMWLHSIKKNLEHFQLLYLPTQIRFPIGGKCVTCYGSKRTNSPGRTKLTNSPGKQQHELSTQM